MKRTTQRLKAAFADHYALERPIGRGGMATVYLARDAKHDRQVAVKVLHPEMAATLGADRFLREIKIAAKLSHPHILPLHDSGTIGRYLYYVMPYVDGASLADRIRRDVQLPVDEALEIVQAIASGLDYAHDQGVVHRDIKPENILFSAGKPMLADFGIALALSAAGGERLTETGMSIGTPAYMSPEQASGDPHLDARSDVYSLACVFYEMLAGQPPYLGPNAQAIMARHVTDPVPPLTTVRPAVGDGLARVVTRALAKVPADRFVAPGEFAEALASADTDGEVTATKSIVVLPFANLSPDPEADYFSDGLTDEIISDLSRIQTLRVISRTSAMRLKGTDKDLRAISRELNVRYVLEGSVRKIQGGLRITAQLVDAAEEAPLWAEKFSGTMDDVLDIQEQVSCAIVDALKLTLTVEESQAIAARPITNLQAYECYLRARNDVWRFTEEAVIHALQYLQEALAIVGDNVLLYAAIAEAYYIFPQIAGSEPEACLERVEDCANKIFDIDAESPFGHCFQGLARWKRAGGAQDGARHLKRALDLSPSDPAILQWVGFYAAEAGRPATAEPCVNRLLAIDPLSPLSQCNLGWLHLMSGRRQAALNAYRKAYELEPDHAQVRFFYAYVLAANGRRDEAYAIIDRMIKDTPGNVWAWMGRFYKNALQRERRKALRSATAELKQAARWSELYSLCMAECYALMGELPQALEWLENAIRRGFLNFPFLAEHAPFLNDLRGEKRFRQLMAKVKRQWNRFEM